MRPDETAAPKPYIPGAHKEAEKIMRRVARERGFSLSFNSRGDWIVRKNRRFQGVILNITSDFSPPAPAPIASRYVVRSAGEELRSAMCDALVAAGILEAA